MITRDLILRCKNKERAAQKQLYDILLPYLAAVCRRYLKNSSDINDALQESFINLFKGIDSFDETRAAFRTWAVRIAINCTLKYNERMYKVETIELIHDSDLRNETPGIIERLSDEDLLRLLRRMPREYFEVFNLNVIDGYSHREIAKLLTIEESLSRQRLSRARKWIVERLERDEDLDVRMRRSV